MKSFQDHLQIVNNFHELGETIKAAQFLIQEYGLENPNFKGFELREKAKPEFILMTTEGALGEPQIIRIPENTFEYPLELMLNLLTHEMIHVRQKTKENGKPIMKCFFIKYFLKFQRLLTFTNVSLQKKALEYFNRMGEGSQLQLKYAAQKLEVDYLLLILE